MTSNPNASVAAVAGAVTILIVYIASIFGLDVPAEAASGFTTLFAAAILFFGKKQPASPSA